MELNGITMRSSPDATTPVSCFTALQAHCCLSMQVGLPLGTDVEEKLPFQKYKNGEGALVFYLAGHMFSFLDRHAGDPPRHWHLTHVNCPICLYIENLVLLFSQ